MSTAANNVLLIVDDVATELGIAPLEARRLIAKLLLPATRIGATGPYRVMAAALESYVAKGAPDVRLPEYVPGGDYFNDADLRYLADAFSSAIGK